MVYRAILDWFEANNSIAKELVANAINERKARG